MYYFNIHYLALYYRQTYYFTHNNLSIQLVMGVCVQEYTGMS